MQHKIFKALLVFVICSLVLSFVPVGKVNAASTVVTPPGQDTDLVNDFTVLQDAVASAVTGDTIDISGNFDWSDAHPAAHAAYLASSQNSLNHDIRGLKIPAGVNNLTITSTLNDAHIIGSGDVNDVDGLGNGVLIFSTFVYAADGAGNANLTVEKLNLDNFEGGITLGWDGGSYPGSMLRDNQVTLAGDFGDKTDYAQNIAFYFGPGENQTITANTVTFMANGTRTEGYFGPKHGASFGFQNSTTGGSLYNGLTISDNTFQVGSTSNGLEETYGIWENGHNDINGTAIHLTGNRFMGTSTDLFTHAFLLSSQTDGLDISGNTLTGVDEVFSSTLSQGHAAGDQYTFKNNTLSDVGGTDGIFLQNVTLAQDPAFPNDRTKTIIVHLIVNWDISNTIDGETGVRGLNELSTAATHATRIAGAATDLAVVYGNPASTAVTADAGWAAAPRFTDADGLNAGQSIAFGYNGFSTVESAIQAVADSGTVNVHPGNYVESGQMVIDKSVTLTGHSTNDTYLRPADNTGTGGDARAWILVKPGHTFNLSNFTLDGNNKDIQRAIMSYSSGSITNNLFQNIIGSGDQGMGVGMYNSMTVSGNRFQNMGRIGIFANGPLVTDAVIANNVYTGKGPVLGLDYGIEIGGGAHATITGNVVTDNTAVAWDKSTSAGIYVHTYYGAGTTATITGNTLVGNYAGIAAGYDNLDTSTVTASFNRIYNNTHGITSSAPTVQAINNWWGCNPGPSDANCNPVDAPVNVTPWLVLTPGADVQVQPMGSVAVKANLAMNSATDDTSSLGAVPDGINASFSAVTGTVAPDTGGSVAGVFTTTFTAPKAVAGTSYQVCTAVDNQAVCSNVIMANVAPVATADTYSTSGSNMFTVPVATGVLANDTDANGDTLTAVLDMPAAHGTLTLSANGAFTYQPTSGFAGTDSFTYHASDGTASSNIVTVTITVRGKIFLPVIMH